MLRLYAVFVLVCSTADGFVRLLCAGIQGYRGVRAGGFRRREGHVRASEGLVLLYRTRAGALWHQSYLGVQHDETERHRLTHDRVPQVKGSMFFL